MNPNKLALALIAAQHDLRAITKDSTNPHFKSKFASLDTIIETVRPILAKHELAVTQGMIEFANNVITVESVLWHSSGECIASRVFIPLAKADPQGAGAALTYGRRFGLSALLCLATDEDDDGNNASRPPAARKAAPKPVASEPVAPLTSKSDEDRQFRGKRLGNYESTELRGFINEPNAPASLKASCRAVLADRSLGNTDDAKVERAKAAVAADDAELPF